MRTNTQTLLVLGLFLVAGLIHPAMKPVEREMANGHLQTKLSPSWTTGIISDAVGPTNIVATDLSLDGVTDIVACSNGSAYVLNRTGENQYDTTWYSERLRCSSVTTGDRDGDTIQEIYVGTSDSKVHIFRGDDFEDVGELSLPVGTGDQTVYGVVINDVDSDGNEEIVLTRPDATFVYDANNLTLEWQATDKGGRQLDIGDIDGDEDPEIVVNGNPAHVLNAILKTEEWAYSGGFGYDMAIGDVDGDNIAEIAYIESRGIVYIFEVDTFTVKWQLSILHDLNVVAVADTDQDGVDEVLVGSGQWGNVTGYRGNDGGQLWQIANPEHGVFGIEVGDADNDGVNEIIWGAGLSSSGKDALFIGDWETESVDWMSDDLDGPLYVAAGDLDNDGVVEIVMISSSTTSNYEGGTIRVYDGLTHELEWSTVVSTSYYDLYEVAVGQLDSDPALEIVVGADNWYDTRLRVYDGITHAMEWESAELASGPPHSLLVMNLDTDPLDEIVVGLSDRHVLVFNGASPMIQWDSGSLDDAIRDLDIGDLDGDSVLDLAVLTNQSVYIFNVGTWFQKLHKPIGGGKHLAIVNGSTSDPGNLLITTSDFYDYYTTLQAWDGVDHELLWRRTLGNDVSVNAIFTSDLEGDGDEEFVLLGDYSPDRYLITHSLLLVGSQITPSFWTEYENDSNWGSITGMVFADIDNDGQGEVVFGSSSLIQVDEITSSPLVIRGTYLPMIAKDHR
ncbi:MAG: VCBS repeat-containing protein [Anaerolineae bacterium]|nr:VCBS repeat-containing protein [Anaerolineae bacterium]MCB0205736.1 VCBS repeat-containing protein [Anaerolineae bacterium]MCB0252608.1 VCBS repeat-containing protein [Anaerolineae bacterium]